MAAPTQEKIDLSHYDLIDTFSAREAACLIAGFDPKTEDAVYNYDYRKFCAAQVIEDAIKEAHKEAERHFKGIGVHIAGIIPDPWVREIKELEPVPYLPCTNMRAWFEHLKNTSSPSSEVAKIKGMSFSVGYEKIKFKREDIKRWLEEKDYNGARYFLSEHKKQLQKLDYQKEMLDRELISLHEQARDLESLRQENAELKAQVEELGASQDIDPRLKNTLYKMIHAMAVIGYKYDPQAARNNAVSDIANDINAAGLKVSNDTIRTHLQEAARVAANKAE
ncbi:MAG: hypothetical protein GX070_05655 [Alcaligenaceae bacterium]|nr:hypothetical protein [Alcaligenaceae bacterium]